MQHATDKLVKLTTALRNAGLRFEIALGEHDWQNLIGIQLHRNVWHWFKQSIIRTDFEIFDFDHSYSQNTGVSKAGSAHGRKVRSAIKAKIGFDIMFL